MIKIYIRYFFLRCPEEFHFDGESDDLEFFEMQEDDEIELFWDGINEKNHERKYHSLLYRKIVISSVSFEIILKF